MGKAKLGQFTLYSEELSITVKYTEIQELIDAHSQTCLESISELTAVCCSGKDDLLCISIAAVSARELLTSTGTFKYLINRLSS